MPFVPPSTDRLRLRHLTSEDAADVFRLNSDPRVMHWFPTNPVPTIEAIRTELDEVHPARYADDDDLGWFGAELTDAPEEGIVGMFVLRPAWRYKYWKECSFCEEDLELGYRFHGDYWNRGLASEGARALVAAGALYAPEKRIVGIALMENIASRRVLEKAGLAGWNTDVHLSDDLPLAATYKREPGS